METAIETITLRHATPRDEPFLRELFEVNASAEFIAAGFPQSQYQPLVDLQYRGRAMTYSAQYPEAVSWIICTESGEAVGRHLLERKASTLRSIDLAILPAWQGKGLGTFVLQCAQQLARSEGVSFHLRVAKGNRAIQLYRRLGFLVAAEDELSYEMTWRSGCIPK
jgi:GNAT superfamily N-acetyltransferase